VPTRQRLELMAGALENLIAQMRQQGAAPDLLRGMTDKLTEIQNQVADLVWSFANIWRQAVGGIQSSFEGFFTSLLDGTARVGTAFGNLFRGMLSAVNQVVSQMMARLVTDWLQGLIFAHHRQAAAQTQAAITGQLVANAEANVATNAALATGAITAQTAATWALIAAQSVLVALGGVGGGGGLPLAEPQMAAGGIVTRPLLALVGEAGPEAIIPLDRAGAGVGAVANVEVHIHAIDTQTGVDFLLKHRDTLASAVQAALRGNAPLARASR